jgi:hypothetical protein
MLNILKKLLESDSSDMMMVVSKLIINVSHIYQNAVMNIFQVIYQLVTVFIMSK